MKLNSKQKGNLTELKCIAAFAEQGCTVCIPHGDCEQYDFIADFCGKLLKIQVKTSSLKRNTENAISFSCRSTHYNSNGANNVRYSVDKVDYFATFWENQCYIIPFNECSVEKTLRFAPPKNGQITGVAFAKDYEIVKQLQKLKEEVVEN